MALSRRVAAAMISVSMTAAGVGVGASAAHADSSNVLYVNDAATANCSDSAAGAGSAATPFCSIQAGANAAVAGDTVDIAAGNYSGDVDIKSVGTAAEPIVFQGAAGLIFTAAASPFTTPGITFDGASYVTFQGFGGPIRNYKLQTDDILVNDSSHITLNNLWVQSSPVLGYAVQIAGDSSAVTVSRSAIVGLQNGIVVDSGSADDVISTNFTDTASGVSLTDDSNAAVTSNTIVQPSLHNYGISVTGGAAGVSVENNIVTYTDSSKFAGTTGPGAEFSVDAASVPGVTADYNVIWPTAAEGSSTPVEPAYVWAGADYATAAAFSTATGQGGHDVVGDPLIYLGSAPYFRAPAPEQNSANSAAPGMLNTDFYGYSCNADPLVPVTGAGSPDYCARGALQPDYTTTLNAALTPVNALTTDMSTSISQTVAYNGGQSTVEPTPTPAVSYTVNWGDGDTQTYPASSTTALTGLAHTYAKPGVYTVAETAKMTDGETLTTTKTFTTTGADYTPSGPTRILDSRSGVGGLSGRLVSGKCYSLPVANVGDVPANVTAISANLTVTDAVSNGWVAVGVINTINPVSNVDYLAGQTVANSVLVPVVDSDVQVCGGGDANASADVILDLTGYFTTSAASGYQPVTPDRVLDTRNGTGAADAKVAANAGVPVAIAGADSIPSGISAVAVHVTVTDTAGNGWIAAEPDGAGVPGTSSLNYLKGQTISNTVIVPVGKDGEIELYNGGAGGSVDLIADVSGYFSATAPEAFAGIVPFRAVDSRADGDGLSADGTQTYSLDTVLGGGALSTFPAGATIAANITATDETANGYLTAYAQSTPRPTISNLNYVAHQNLGDFALLGTTGSADEVDVYNNSTGSTDIIFDVSGYFSSI